MPNDDANELHALSIAAGKVAERMAKVTARHDAHAPPPAADGKRDDAPMMTREQAARLIELLERQSAESEDEEEENENEAEAADDDDARPRRKRRHKRAADDADPEPTAAGGAPSIETDDDRVAETQHRADSVAFMHGRKIDRPRIAERDRSYKPRVSNQLKALLPATHPMYRCDFRLIKDPVALDHQFDELIEEVRKAAYTTNPPGIPPRFTREIKHPPDRTGRQISTFVAVDENGKPCVGDWLDRFRLPRMKVTFNERLAERALERIENLEHAMKLETMKQDARIERLKRGDK